MKINAAIPFFRHNVQKTQTFNRLFNNYEDEVILNLKDNNSKNGKCSSIMKLPLFFKKRDRSGFIKDMHLYGPKFISNGTFIMYNSENKIHSPWKIHVYADTEKDYQKLVTLLAPYLIENDVNWKTFGLYADIDKFNNSTQKGKAITIYPHNNEEFAKLTHDIDFAIRKNKLELTDSSIDGDRKLGTTGRIFYRYEYRSKNQINLKLDLSKHNDSIVYEQIYDSNRGLDNYLANDMTTYDDPWFLFDPKYYLDIG